VTTPTQGTDVPPAAGSQDLPPDVAARLRAVPAFAGGGWLAEELPGGLTNRNYKVSLGGASYVARLSGPTGSLLAIDRDAEFACSRAAAAAGVAPRVVDYVPESAVLVIEWVDGRTYSPGDLSEYANLVKVTAACRRLHEAPRFEVDFDMFAIQRRYLDVVQLNGFRLPERYLEFMPRVETIGRALAVRAEPTAPCHNDLLAANLIDDGDLVWLIDYEYAGNNDPCFELGNLWSESTLAADLLDEIVRLYYGKALRNKVARARLLALMSKYGWTLWASIQDGVSELDFDFWTWGMEKYDRAVAEFDGPDLPRWIEEVQRED
jgi:thiamine kinase-like enzyme